MKNYLRHFKQVPKFLTGDQIEYLAQLDAESDAMLEADEEAALNEFAAKGDPMNQADDFIANQELKKARKQAAADAQAIASGTYNKKQNTTISTPSGPVSPDPTNNANLDKATRGLGIAGSISQTLMPQTTEEVTGVNEMMKRIKAGEFDAKSAARGVAAAAVSGAAQVADDMFMGDKNFGAQSEAIDQAVHGVSSALMKSGNPYCVCAGTKIYTDSGYKNIEDLKISDKLLGYDEKKAKLLNIEYLFEPHLKECVQIETEGGNTLRCSLDHPILVSREGRARYVTVGKKKQRRIREFNFVDASTIRIGDHVAEIGSIPLFGDHHVKLAYLLGMLIGDGTYGKGKAPRLFTGDPDTWAYLEKYRLGELLERHTDERYSSEFRVYQFKGLQPIMRSYGLFGQTKKQKRLPSNLHMWDKESCAALLAGLFDTDGCVSVRGKDSRIIFYQSNLDLLHEVKQLLLKFGVHTYIQHFDAKDKKIKNRNAHSGESWGLVISRKDSVINFYNNIALNISYKQNNLFKIYSYKSGIKGRDTSYEYHNLIADKVKRIIPLGLLPVYNLQVSGPHTYVANNIVTHNCMAAGAALEGANFLTKAGGQTVQGFDVDIESSGYGQMGHKASSSSRNWSTLVPGLGLGLLNNQKIEAKLAKRNQEALMAMNAANIANEQKFEQEARMKSVQNVITNNQIALSGGLSTSALAAKRGGKLERLKNYKPSKHKNGGKLKNVELSEESSVIPEGALHAHKHNLDLDGITQKGIPVLQNIDESVETLEEIKKQGGELQQSAEIEREEIIFSKELTDYIEEARAEWHETNSNDILEEVGKRVTKELLFNTRDNAGLIEEMK